MTTLLCLLEERSARSFLEELLPRLPFLPNTLTCRYSVFDGKQDLEKRLTAIIKGWQEPDTVFLVMRDQDSADCKEVKKKLMELCKTAGKADVIIRVACHELESFYFGDLSAVEKALKLEGISSQAKKAQYRLPDTIVNPSKELYKITHGEYKKLSGSRAIGKEISLENNKSISFNALLDGLRKRFI